MSEISAKSSSQPPLSTSQKHPFNIMNYLLADTSISKAASNKFRAERMISIVKIRESVLKSQKEVRKVSQQQRMVQETWENLRKTELLSHSEKKKSSEHAALLIQKIVRGFLIRIKIDSILLNQRESRASTIIKDLRVQTDFCMLTLGSNTIPAVIKIQGAYHRYLFRKKLKIMHQAYKLYLMQREEMVCDYLRQALWNYSSKIKRDYLIFLRYRVKRLEEIKRSLAILVVKKIWRAKKLTFKVIKEKFVKIKRRKAAMQNKEAYQKYLSTMAPGNGKKEAKRRSEVNSRSESGMLDEKKEENPEEDLEYKEAQKIKDIIEKKIKEKVSMSKLAYAIEENTTKLVIPMMQERALNENLDADSLNSKLLHLTASVFAKGRNLSREMPPAVTRNYQIFSPRAVSQRKHYDKAILPPLSIIPAADVPLDPHSPKTTRQVLNEHFLYSTVSSFNKSEPPIISEWQRRQEEREMKEKQRARRARRLEEEDDDEVSEKSVKRVTREIKIKERSFHWIPVARRFSSYVPGIDNSGYVPIKWTPLPLNKRILNTPLTSISHRRHRSAAFSPNPTSPNGEATSFSHSNRIQKYFREQPGSGSISTQEQSVEITT